MKGKFKNFLLDLFFPKFCFNCRKEGEYLCLDCQALLDILRVHFHFRTKNISDLYYALPYKENSLTQKLLHSFKYDPFVKELAETLAWLVISHFQLLDKKPDFLENKSDFILIPVPLEKKREKWRGFNQAKELAAKLAEFLAIPAFSDVLIKIKATSAQTELEKEERRQNVRGVFSCENREKIKVKKILLVDDVYTTGSTMEECAKTLRENGAKQVIGIAVARD